LLTIHSTQVEREVVAQDAAEALHWQQRADMAELLLAVAVLADFAPIPQDLVSIDVDRCNAIVAEARARGFEPLKATLRITIAAEQTDRETEGRQLAVAKSLEARRQERAAEVSST
jgi:hypothetical protein